jgi:hypothetical protein
MITGLTRSHESATVERFQRDPDFAAEYLAAPPAVFAGAPIKIGSSARRDGGVGALEISVELN